MNRYVATFFSHFGALSYFKALKGQGVASTLAPVPRALSASCGTCVRYEHGSAIDLDGCELDHVYAESGGTLVSVLTKE